MKVFKFGGASVKDAEGVRNVQHIVEHFSERKGVLIVLSAMGKSTNSLEAILAAYLNREDFKGLIEQMKAYHVEIAQELFQDPKASIFKQLDNLFYLLERKLQEPFEDADERYDQVVCFGELVSSHILAAYLNASGIPTQFIDARIYIQTSETWREGQIDWVWTEKMIQAELPEILSNHVIVTQGFIGGTISNKTTTLGREGSDFSAAIFANCLNADSVTIWKDVPGIMTSDPRKVPTAEMYERLSYRNAAEMTYYGASVIHPKTIRPLALKKIPLHVRSFLKPADPGTVIGEFDILHPKPAIIFKKKQSLLRFEEKDFLNVNKSNLGMLMNELHRCNVHINLMRSSAISFTVCVDTEPTKFEKLSKVLERHFNIYITDGLELVTIRNYREDTIEQFPIQANEVYMEQKTRETWQFVRISDGNYHK